MNVLFVDLGNICRSPIAAALLKKKYLENGISGVVDSAGFESFTINEPPDVKAVNVAASHGVLLDGRARIFQKEDFDKFDKIYVMDTKNYNDVLELAKKPEHKAKVDYLLNTIEPGKNDVIIDPCSTGEIDMEGVFKKIDQATDKIVETIKEKG